MGIRYPPAWKVIKTIPTFRFDMVFLKIFQKAELVIGKFLEKFKQPNFDQVKICSKGKIIFFFVFL